MRHVLVTIPRTGSNYLIRLIQQKTKGFQIIKTHSFPKEHRHIITIARDPRDTILSTAAMNAHSGNWQDNNFSGFIDEYVKLGSRLYDEARIIISYDDLIKHPDEVVKYLANVMNIKYTDKEYTNTLSDNQELGYLVSSQTSMYYHMLEPLMDTLDLSEAYEIYHKMLSKSIKIGD